ncbi:MAG: hypothetical protein WC565_07165 [Parcubacteria group bacterium]
MRQVAIDWAFAEEKLAVYDGKKVLKAVPKLKAGDEIFAENIPMKHAAQWLKDGIIIRRCRPNDTAALRKEIGQEKTDALDAKLIWQLAEAHPEKFREWKGDPQLTTLYRAFKEVQRCRVGQSNRVWAKGEETATAVLDDLEKTERKIVKAIEKELKSYKVWDWLSQIKGIGVATGGGLVGLIAKYGIENIRQVSSLWHLFGLHVVEGKAPRRTKGEEVSYVPEAKTLVLGVIADCFIKQRSPVYRDIYDQEKARQLEIEYPEGELASKFLGYKKSDTHLSLNHAHRRAIRKMMKIFVQHVWLAWRTCEGLETRPLYCHEYLGHEHFIEPPVKIQPEGS